MSAVAPPWSGGQLKRLGKCIRDEVAVPADLPPYEEVMAFYNDVAVETQDRIQALDFESLLGSRPYEVTSRSKTIDTLRQKLQRDRATPLSSVQDVAGVRFEAEMSLDEQDAVANAIIGCFDHTQEAIRDLRNDPHSGYRAVHVWLRLPVRVEVQIRTHLQGGWANLYEVAADVLGRDIRYGHAPSHPAAAKVVKDLHHISLDTIQELENLRNTVEQTRARHENIKRMLAHNPSKHHKRMAKQHQGSHTMLEEAAATLRSLEEQMRDAMIALTETLMASNSKGLSWLDS